MAITAACSNCKEAIFLGNWVFPSVPPDVFTCASCGQKNLLAYQTLFAMLGPILLSGLVAGLVARLSGVGSGPLIILSTAVGFAAGVFCGRRYAKLRKWRPPLV